MVVVGGVRAMTDEQLADIRKWLEQASEPCGNDACIGEWAAVHGRALLDEVERLREENEWLEDEADGYMCAESYTAWERDEAEAEVERLRELLRQREWVSIADRDPQVWQRVMAYTKQKLMDITSLNDLGDWSGKLGDGLLFGDRVTHWMPLPEPPEVTA